MASLRVCAQNNVYKNKSVAVLFLFVTIIGKDKLKICTYCQFCRRLLFVTAIMCMGGFVAQWVRVPDGAVWVLSLWCLHDFAVSVCFFFRGVLLTVKRHGSTVY